MGRRGHAAAVPGLAGLQAAGLHGSFLLLPHPAGPLYIGRGLGPRQEVRLHCLQGCHGHLQRARVAVLEV